MARDILNYLLPCLPADHARQVTSRDVASQILESHTASRILDLGCGNGNSVDFFRGIAPRSEWIGIDIEESPEVATRVRSDAKFLTFDGINIPFEDGFFDFIFSHQVFEHVRFPERLLAEVQRVLSPTGLFVGSTSQLEPYHSYSLWNYTVYGFKRLSEDAGLEMLQMRPGIDGITLIQRSYLQRPAAMSKFFSEESPLNQEIGESGLARKRDNIAINFRKLLYCGHFVFVARRKAS